MERKSPKRTVSGIIFLLILTTTWASLFAVHPAKSASNLQLEMSVNKTVIAMGESIDITLTLKNAGDVNLTFIFYPPFFDAYYCISEKCYNWSDNVYFIPVLVDLTIEP